jgi:terminase small subunit-like protein
MIFTRAREGLWQAQTKLQNKKPVSDVALGTRPSDNKSDNNTKGKKMQKKIDRMPKKAFLPGRLTGDAPLPPLGRTGRREEAPLIKLPKQETDNKECKSRTGRPTIKTPELCAEICRRISEGETLTNICRDPDMPAWTTVHDWKKADESFGKPWSVHVSSKPKPGQTS